jgi:hypothetical protein
MREAVIVSAARTPIGKGYRGAFGGAAELVLKLNGDLQNTQAGSGELLPETTILNVNYPPVSPERVTGGSRW